MVEQTFDGRPHHGTEKALVDLRVVVAEVEVRAAVATTDTRPDDELSALTRCRLRITYLRHGCLTSFLSIETVVLAVESNY